MATGSFHRRGWIIAASFLIAFMLTAMPLPNWADPWRPAWVAMVLIYWCLALPNRVGVFVGFCLGLLLDVLVGAKLGQNALGLCVIAFIAVSNHHRIRVFPLGQQALIVGLLILLYEALMHLVRVVFNATGVSLLGLYLPVIPSMVLWPWLFIILRDVRRRANLH